MVKNRWFYIIWVFFYLLVFSFLLFNSFNYLDTDFGWHLKVGQEIWQEKNVPTIEKYDYSTLGQNWVDHEWLMNLALFKIYDQFGYITLNFLFAFIIIIILLLQNIFIRYYFHNRSENKIENDFKFNFLIFVFQIFGVIAMSPHFGVRIQEITLLFIILLLFILEKYRRDNKIKFLFFLPLIFYLWANAHGSFLIGWFILLVWMIIKIAENVLFRWKNKKIFGVFSFDYKLGKKVLKKFFIFFLSAIGIAFFTPYGLKIFTLLKDYTNTFYMTRIDEWLPAYYLPIQYNQLIFIGVLIFIIILNLFFYIYGQKIKNNNNIRIWVKFDPFYFSATLIFIFLALKSKRHFPLLFIISFPLLLELYYFFIKIKLSKKLSKYFFNKTIIKIYLVCGFLLATATLALKTNFTDNPWNNKIFCKFYPCQATDFIKADTRYKDLRIFNDYGWGGFLIWTWPEKLLFIDGRMPQLVFKNHTFLEEYYDFFAKDRAIIKLSEHKIALVMIRKNDKLKLNWFEKYVLAYDEEKINNGQNYLKKYLSDSADWQLIYSDIICDLYARKNKL